MDIIKRAEQGNADAQYELAGMYEDGNGIEEDIDKAVYWYTKAAEQGLADAQFELGVMYFNGDNVEIDDVKGADLIRQAADQGHQDALEWFLPDIEGGHADPWE